MAKLPESAKVADEELAEYLLLTNAHDGTRAMEVLLTPVRVVCWNTLSVALRTTTSKVKIRHTRNAGQWIGEAQRVLGLAGAYFAEHAQTMNKLADYKPDRAFVEAYLQALVPDPKGDASPTRARKSRATIGRLYAGRQAGGSNEAVRGTAFGLLNAVTEFVDHYRTVRKTGTATRAENRMESVLYGSGAQLRDRAYGLMAQATGIGFDGVPLVAANKPDPSADDVLSMVSVN